MEAEVYKRDRNVPSRCSDRQRTKEETFDENMAVVPYETLIPNKHFYDVKPHDDKFALTDVCSARENLVKAKPPLEAIQSLRYGEFTPAGWAIHHQESAYNVNTLLNESEKLRQESSNTSFHTRNKTQSMQDDSTLFLDQRIKATLDAKSTLLRQKEASDEELHFLRQMRNRIQAAMFALELPESNNRECFHIRDFRGGLDNTRDGVSLALDKEFEVLRTGRQLLVSLDGELNAGICRLLEIKRLVEHDWSDKQEAMQIDHSAAKLRVKPHLAQFKLVSAALNEGFSTPLTWKQKVEDHLNSSRTEIGRNERCRSNADHALTEITTDILRAYEDVDEALEVSIGRFRAAIRALTEDSQKVLKEIMNQEENIANLRQELEQKEPPLQVSQMRHFARSFRPGFDRCLDNPHYSLISETEQLPKTIKSLRDLVDRSQETLEELHQRHEDLVKNIVFREHGLSLETRCTLIRKDKPIAAKLKGY